MEAPSYVASGAISPCRFVAGVPGSAAYAFQAVATSSQVIGVSQDGPYYAPGMIGFSGANPAAPDGVSFRVYAPGEECLLELGGLVSANTFLGSDSSGRGVMLDATVTANPTWVGAYCLDNGLTGDIVRVIVRQFPYVDN